MGYLVTYEAMVKRPERGPPPQQDPERWCLQVRQGGCQEESPPGGGQSEPGTRQARGGCLLPRDDGRRCCPAGSSQPWAMKSRWHHGLWAIAVTPVPEPQKGRGRRAGSWRCSICSGICIFGKNSYEAAQLTMWFLDCAWERIVPSGRGWRGSLPSLPGGEGTWCVFTSPAWQSPAPAGGRGDPVCVHYQLRRRLLFGVALLAITSRAHDPETYTWKRSLLLNNCCGYWWLLVLSMEAPNDCFVTYPLWSVLLTRKGIWRIPVTCNGQLDRSMSPELTLGQVHISKPCL